MRGNDAIQKPLSALLDQTMSPIRPRRCPHLAINNRHPPPPRSFAPLPTRGEELGNKLGTPQSSRARRTAGFRTHPVATSSSFRLTLPRPQDIRTSRNAKSDPRVRTPRVHHQRDLTCQVLLTNTLRPKCTSRLNRRGIPYARLAAWLGCLGLSQPGVCQTGTLWPANYPKCVIDRPCV